MSQVASAHQSDLPLAFNLQNPLQLLTQVGDVVACALLAKFAKMRQVLTDLGRANAKLATQLVRRSDLLPVGCHKSKGAQVYG